MHAFVSLATVMLVSISVTTPHKLPHRIDSVSSPEWKLNEGNFVSILVRDLIDIPQMPSSLAGRILDGIPTNRFWIFLSPHASGNSGEVNPKDTTIFQVVVRNKKTIVYGAQSRDDEIKQFNFIVKNIIITLGAARTISPYIRLPLEFCIEHALWEDTIGKEVRTECWKSVKLGAVMQTDFTDLDSTMNLIRNIRAWQLRK